jgi:3-hydroxyisobutyrate dehydrogenase-like beta-hydroxyacid dehydrogenase
VQPTGGKLGIIGLGLVGSALAERLLTGGSTIQGFDIQREQVARFAAAGGVNAASASEAARGCDVLLLSLPTSEIVAQVLNEVEAEVKPGAIVIDTTTGGPEEIESIGARLAGRGVFYLDATIGGSSRQVREGESIAMCGGDPGAYARCAGLFALCFRQSYYLGPCGSGSRMKLVLNLVLGLNRAVLAEGLEYARACGMDPEEALRILRASPAYSRVMDTKGAKMLAGDFEPEARLSQHLKDVRLILGMGERHGAKLPLTSLHHRLLEQIEASGLGAADNSAIITAFESDRK